MLRIDSTDADAQRLEQAFLQATGRKLRDRLQIIRMAHQGRPHPDLAVDLGVTPRTVRNWLNAYLQGGIAALQPRKAKGHAAAIPPQFASVIRRWVIVIDEAMAADPHLESKRLPSSSPQLNIIEHFWRSLRRRTIGSSRT